jgi:hypothetical protein
MPHNDPRTPDAPLSSSSPLIRNRIKTHRKVRAADLVPHEWNFRVHPESQKSVLNGIYQEVGFARSLLAFELPDGRLKLIDGHLRRDFDPDMEVDVEVLDVTEEEARKLLLTIDPLASLAEEHNQIRERLLHFTPAESPELQLAWQTAVDALLDTPHKDPPPGFKTLTEQYLILVTCADETEQVELLTRFMKEGVKCKALLA